MKLTIYFFLLLTFATLLKNRTAVILPIEDRCKTILDSAVVLVQTGEFSINGQAGIQVNGQAGIQDKKRGLSISRWFEKRSFSELTCLLESNNKLYRMYGYMLAAMHYEDSLQNKYADLLTDTTSIQFIGETGIIDTLIPMGTFLFQVRHFAAKDHEDMNKEPAIREKVSEFIRNYASFPDTYIPVSFPVFSFGSGSGSDTSTNFNIRHTYQIKNNYGRIIQHTDAFVLDGELNIMGIEQDSSNLISARPPKVEDWFKRYGRPLTNADSIKLKLNTDLYRLPF